MQVVSGRIDRPIVHFEAPPAIRVPMEMAKFISWFNQSAQRGNEVTSWVRWFVAMVAEAQRDAEVQICFVASKARFIREYGGLLNERQSKAIQRMFDAGPDGFIGGMNARKFMALTGASKATATRDLQELARLGAFVSIGGGRSVRYELGGMIPV